MPATDNCFIQLPTGATGKMKATVYDISGRIIKTFEQKVTPSVQNIIWDLKGNNNMRVAPGAYFMAMSINNKDFYRAKIAVMNK